MQKTLKMASGLLAATRIRFPFVVLAAAAIGCVFVPWSSVWIFMDTGVLHFGVLHFAAWAWAVASAVFALSSIMIIAIDSDELSNFPLWWSICMDTGTDKEYVEVWRVLMWLLFVPAELASIALLPVIWLLRYPCRLFKYPWRILRTVITFEIDIQA